MPTVTDIMKYRKHIRLKDYDYKANGYYFITICTNYRKPYLKDEIYKDIIEKELLKLPERFKGLDIDWYKIMPDHIHCIFVLDESEKSLSEIIGAYKSITTNVVAPLVGAKISRDKPCFRVSEANERHIIRNRD